MKPALLLIMVALLLSSANLWADPPVSAEKLLSNAKSQAVAEHKTIFLVFDASWWGWCRRLDKFIETKEIKPILEKHFVLVKLVVNESPTKKDLENPGGTDVLNKVEGGNAGLPFFAFLNAKGDLIVNSKMDGRGNIGHPYQPEEVSWFMTMVSKAAPDMGQTDRQVIESWLRNQKK